MPIPSNPDALLRRRELAQALTEAGFPVARSTLATWASRGGGPPFRLFGRVPLYQWGPSLGWAHDRLSPPRRSKTLGEGPERTEGMTMKIDHWTVPAAITLELAMAVVEDNLGINDHGFCLNCGTEICSGVEPDARGYTCEACKAPAVYGAEEVFMHLAGMF